MKILRKIILFVGFLTLAVSGSDSRYTGRDVASLAVVRYNTRSTSPNLFKLLQVTTAKIQGAVRRTLYNVSFLIKETICNRDEGNDVTDCAFKDDGMEMTCNTMAIQSLSFTQLKFW
ncbi:cathelicidin-related antimicrobial peptide Na_CRAMP-like isoform X2 [Pristis pectinata]|nr:cathelicidin-related antimicrobial peptide Na_CRAMP-like isoform X2 [Pristis pectinata]